MPLLVAPAAVRVVPPRIRRRTECAAASPLPRTAPRPCCARVPQRCLASARLRTLRCAATAGGAIPEGSVVSELAALSGCTVYAASTGAPVPAASLVPPSGTAVLLFLTQWGDFDSFELAQRLVDALPALAAANVRTAAIGVGSVAGARLFSELTSFPLELLHADPDAACYAALGFAPGAGRVGGPFPALQGLPGSAKLLAMCAGLGSPGTLSEVFRGYLGDRDAPPVFNAGTNVDLAWRDAFNLVGTGFQRPFELATLRGSNMVTILRNWDTLAPADADLLVQRGGVCVFRDGALTWRHDDAGILGYARPSEVLRAAGVDAPLPPGMR